MSDGLTYPASAWRRVVAADSTRPSAAEAYSRHIGGMETTTHRHQTGTLCTVVGSFLSSCGCVFQHHPMTWPRRPA